MSELQWLAGIVDSNGSFSISIRSTKRATCMTDVRQHRLRISSADDKTIPEAARILGVNFTDDGQRKSITMTAGACRSTLPELIPLLHTKRKQAEAFYEALMIKRGSMTRYTEDQKNNWLKLKNELCSLNKGGEGAYVGSPVDHDFNWPWLAGIIDGNGLITTAKFGGNNHKPFIKISMTNHYTMDHIAENLGKDHPKEDKVKGKYRTTKTIRLMSNDIVELVPKFFKYLVSKRKQAELAYVIAAMRKKQKTSNTINPKVAWVLSKLRSLNA